MEQTLGKRIVGNRKRLGLTQDQLAERLGVTAQAVSKWENDQSCPDITMLPKLAEIFGITSDQLLGIAPKAEAPAQPAEIVCQGNEPEGIPINNGKWEFKYEAGRYARVGIALWVLLVGGLLLAVNLLKWDVGLWDILWSSGLLVFGLAGLYPKFSFFRLGCGLFGGYFLLENLGILPFSMGKALLLPIAILLFGLSLLVDALRKNQKPQFLITRDGKQVCDGEKRHVTNLVQEGEAFACSTNFGEDTHAIELHRISRGEAEVSFGELTVDLSGCEEVSDDCRIDADCSFGELTLLVPRRFRVIHTKDSSFASVDISGHPDPEPQGTIHINCSVSFGEIQIRYI